MSRKPQDNARPKDAPRRGGVRPIAAALPKVAAKAIGRRGFAEASLITDWAAVVGDALAAASQPVRLAFPPGKRASGTLHIRVSGGVATELQHLEPLVVERINSHFGYSAVTRLKLIHAPLVKHEPARRREPARASPPDPAKRDALAALLDGVEDTEVRAALERLGNAILARESQVK